ncbi:hypothetical protein Bca52824_063808 [Brassica carinata]|uniref:Uncharacterized protein n=1 Tax=Brassica carinata TaxID=52824 RepID=A0A8X7QJR9_BRACI|nr:hypothetical protein Bca52824_063808 [Brassica carinata]
MSSSIVSSVLFLLLLVFSLHMDDASGAQTEIRKLKESVKKIRILEGGENRSSKTAAGGSTTKRCKGLAKTFKNMATTYRPGHGQFRPLSGVYLNAIGLLLRLDVRDALKGSIGDRLKLLADRLTDQLGEAVCEYAKGNYKKQALELLGSDFNAFGYKEKSYTMVGDAEAESAGERELRSLNLLISNSASSSSS